MNIPETYDYLVRARRDLWGTLEGVPDEVYPASCWMVRSFTASKTSSFT
jgi:hypothetical protein